MKKLFLLLALFGLIFTACEAGGGLNGGGSGDLPLNKIATIEEQGANIKATIATLETTKSAVNATIASLNEQQPVTRGNDNGNNGVKDMIAALEERLAALEQMISNLTDYTQGDLAEMQDWATATFATMEQYNALAAELATLKALLESFEGVSTAELSEALAASEESMKQWVNEQLAGYATIADVEAQIVVLTASLTEELKAEVEQVVATLTALMNETKQEYEKAITEAIQNQGIINDKIAEDIANINKRIDEELATINKRLDDIEKRLEELENAVTDLINRIQTISYLEDDNAEVITSPEGSTLTLSFQISPREAVGSLIPIWKEAIHINARYKNTTPPIFVDMPVTSFYGDVKNGIITITASGENLSADFFTGTKDVAVALEISDGNNYKISEYIDVYPRRWSTDNISSTPTDNEIWYLTSDKNPITLPSTNGFGAQFESNTFHKDHGFFVIRCSSSIKSIGSELFSGATNLVSISLPQTITSIGVNAFNGCRNLSSVIVSDISTWLGISFGNASANPTSRGASLYVGEDRITSIVVPSDIITIKNYAFYNCTSLTSITIPDSVTSIGNSAFEGCTSLTSVTIPDSVTEIGRSPFDGCSNLIDIYVNITNLAAYATKNSTHSLPGNKHLLVNDTEITELVIPDSITSIGDSAFTSCTSLTSITIPDSVTSIGLNAFQDCTNITMVDIANISAWCNIDFMSEMSNPIYYAKALHVNGVQVEDLAIPDSVTEIKKYAFYNCSAITNVVIPSTVTLIENLSFTGCTKVALFTFKHTTPISVPKKLFSSVENLKISIPVEACESYLYSSWPIEYIQAIVELGCYMYNRSDLHLVYKTSDDVKLDGVYDAGEDVFSHTYVNGQGVIIFRGPNYMETIKACAFENCTTLISINIPRYVKAIESYAFAGTGLTEISIPDHVETIAEGSFRECANLRVVSIGNGISSISDNAFANCTDLTDLTFGNKVNSIGNSAFSNCASLLRVEIPNTVSTIKDGAFSGCVNLITTIVPASVTSLGKNAFTNCTGELLINSKVIEKDVSKGDSAFSRAHFSNITIGNNITVIGKYMFYCFNQNNLKTVTIPESVTTIGTGAFYNCTSLKSVYCKPTTPPTGNSYMFDYKVSGRKIYVPRNSESAYKAADSWSNYADYIVGYDF